MKRPARHLCIATGQNLANLIPCLQLRAREVLILETPAMRDAAVNLKRALEEHDVLVRRLPFDDSTPEEVSASAEAIALELGAEPLVFNATGGHKLMTLALAENLGALADDLHLLYAETRKDRLDWLKPTPAMQPMDDMLVIDDILRAQGYRRTDDGDRDGFWQALADKRATLTRRLGDEADRYGKFFGSLNWLAGKALDEATGNFNPLQSFKFKPSGDNAALLRDASNNGLIDWDGEETIVFATRDAAAYFGGGWLEEYVWHKLRGIKPRDWAINLKTMSYGTNVENEFDALVAHRNRLLAIECKTSGFGRNDAKDVSYIYKLAQLADQVGGAMSQKLLLSARPVHDDIRQRARDYGVDILAAEEVKQFVDFMKKWMKP